MSVPASGLFARPPPAGAKKAPRRIAPVLVTPMAAPPQGGHEQPHQAPKSANLTGPSSQFGRSTGTAGQQRTEKAFSEIERKAREVDGDIHMPDVPEHVWKQRDEERAARMKKLNEMEDHYVKNTNEEEELAKERKKSTKAPKKTASAPKKKKEAAAPAKHITKDGKCMVRVEAHYRVTKSCPGDKKKPKPKRKLRETAAILGVKRRRANAKK